MILVIVFILSVVVGTVCPTLLSLFLFVADLFLPDPFPFVDEVGLCIALVGKLKA